MPNAPQIREEVESQQLHWLPGRWVSGCDRASVKGRHFYVDPYLDEA